MDNAIVLKKLHGQAGFLAALVQRACEKYKRATEKYRQVARTNRPKKIRAHKSVCKEVKAPPRSKKTMNCSGRLESTKASRSKGTLKPERNCYHVTRKMCAADTWQ